MKKIVKETLGAYDAPTASVIEISAESICVTSPAGLNPGDPGVITDNENELDW